MQYLPFIIFFLFIVHGILYFFICIQCYSRACMEVMTQRKKKLMTKIHEEVNGDINDEEIDEEFYEAMYTSDGNLCINACAKSISGYDPC